MANIIEREIEKREALILDKSEKEKRLEALKVEAEALEKEIADTDVTVLQAEIDELKTYLPKPVDEEVEEVVLVEGEPQTSSDVVNSIVIG